MWLLARLIFKRDDLDTMDMASDLIDETKLLMRALLRQPPKLHDDMKVGKKKSAQEQPASKPKRKASGTSPDAKR